MKSTFSHVLLLLMLGVLINIGAAAQAKTSLFDRLGRNEHIKPMAADFVKRLQADKRVNKYLASSNIPQLKEDWHGLICSEAGGPCKPPLPYGRARCIDDDMVIIKEDIAKSLNLNTSLAEADKQLVLEIVPKLFTVKSLNYDRSKCK